jgi:exopolyphosphatase/guanosine-5'-triphosphate,3'-diphosphate pyrophosphatase
MASDAAQVETMRIGAVDVGSNGIRMVVAELDEAGALHEIENSREPVRLGADAFDKGRFTPATIRKTVKAFTRFAAIFQAHNVTKARAVATSAVRDASNGRQLIDSIQQATGLRLQVISGLTEAQLVFEAVAGAVGLQGRTAMLVDMGGGSVEITISRNGQAMGSETLPLGCVRLMQELRRRKPRWHESRTEQLIARYRGTISGLVRAELDDEQPQIVVGTGGNIEALAKLRTQLLPKIKTGKVKLSDLDLMVPKLLDMSVEQRIRRLGLRPDRADVIAIAAVVLRMVMQDAGIYRMLVPGVGLKEGVLRQIADDIQHSHIGPRAGKKRR